MLRDISYIKLLYNPRVNIVFTVFTFCISTNPIPLAEASPWPSTDSLELKYCRIGAEVTTCLTLSMAFSCSVDQLHSTPLWVSHFSGSNNFKSLLRNFFDKQLTKPTSLRTAATSHL